MDSFARRNRPLGHARPLLPRGYEPGAVGLHDRGVVSQGMRADLNVIDFDHLRCEAPVMSYDLPAGGKRLLQRARGYRVTVVGGQITYRDGEPTGALPGRLVRATG